MLIAICLNCLLAAFVGWLTYRLWGCRSRLAHLNELMQSAELGRQWTPQRLSYRLTLSRAQIAETRLGVALWQRRSQQVRQVLQAVKYLQMLSLYRAQLRQDAAPKRRT